MFCHLRNIVFLTLKLFFIYCCIIIIYTLSASCASDRSIILYDTREVKPMRKIIMKLKTNQLVWNPMEAYIFTAANEDYK